MSSAPPRTDDNELHGVGAHNAEPDLPGAHTAGNAGRPLQVSPDQRRRLATRSLASRIRPIIAMSNAPRLRAFVARSIRPTFPLRGSYAVFLMAQ